MSLIREVDGALTRVAAGQAENIRSALASSVRVNDVVEDFLRTFPEGSTASVKECRDWARVHIRTSDKELQSALRNLYAVGFVLGRSAGLAHYARVALQKATSLSDLQAALSVNWDDWQPGNEAAAALARPKGGLQRLLDRNVQQPVMIKGFNQTTLDRIGTRLADGLASGATRTDLASSLREVVSDPRRALVIANTEMSRAMNVGLVDQYGELGVEKVVWEALDPCDLCSENDGVEVELGSEFPSGDSEPPAHPNCRCAVNPVLDDGVEINDAAAEDMGFSSQESYDLADQVLANAVSIEPAITQQMKELESSTNGTLEGLQYRLKSKDSLARKIEADSVEKSIPKAQAADRIMDSVRYTLTYSPGDYAASAQDVLDQLANAGYTAKVKNYWTGREDYKGINVQLTHSSGQKIELQFHTKQSLQVKEKQLHPLYEKYRKMDEATPEAKSIWQKMVDAANTIKTPAGAVDVGRMNSQKFAGRSVLRWA